MCTVLRLPAPQFSGDSRLCSCSLPFVGDYRVGPMLIVIKNWAKAHEIKEARHGLLSSYGITLLVLHYLQGTGWQLALCMHRLLYSLFCYARPSASGIWRAWWAVRPILMFMRCGTCMYEALGVAVHFNWGVLITICTALAIANKFIRR